MFFFVSGHVPPLLRNVEDLFLDKGIARLFGEFFALSCLGAGTRLPWMSWPSPPSVRYMANVTAEESFRALMD